MLCSELIGKEWSNTYEDINITGIAYDSRNVLPGNVFVCIKGFESDGHKFAQKAVENGAAVVVAEDELDVDVPVWYVEDTRKELARLSCKYYDEPSRKFKLIGVTGTNGKTTITYLVIKRENLFSLIRICPPSNFVVCYSNEIIMKAYCFKPLF